uniref:Cytochrome c biogenesis protein CcsB n=1 Tax=Olisthodiscus luteus TaxID=83000 RepID=A0A7U0QFZ3_OLILU|nr:cytochrome c biogenesis protein [Olisthodiscus luteus]QQW50471.1 cytochrome c biogenesis protein [Olisthodiscus luteus]
MRIIKLNIMKNSFRFWRALISLKVTIGILLLIVILSTFGSIVPQEQTIDFYKNNYSSSVFLNWKIILAFGFDHLYSTWWFIALLFIFSFNLAMCTFLQQLPNLKFFKRCYFYFNYSKFKNLEYYHKLGLNNFTKSIPILKKQNYLVFQTHNSIYGHKGLTGRIAPIIVHISLILILFGSFYNSLAGFISQEIITRNETVHIQNTLSIGKMSFLPKVSTRLNDFWIQYTKQGKIKQFYSDLSLVNNFGEENRQKTISVNKPLDFKGIVLYQTDWGISRLRFILDNINIQVPLQNIQKKQWLGILWNNNMKIFPVLITEGSGELKIYNQFEKKLHLLELNSFVNNIYFFDIIFTTGLQIKVDPGVWYVYFGFFLLMVSGILSYLTFSQIWLLNNGVYKFVGGKTNRAKFNFKIMYSNFIKSLYK